MSCRTVLYHITSQHITSHHITRHHITARHFTSRHITCTTCACAHPGSKDRFPHPGPLKVPCTDRRDTGTGSRGPYGMSCLSEGPWFGWYIETTPDPSDKDEKPLADTNIASSAASGRIGHCQSPRLHHVGWGLWDCNRGYRPKLNANSTTESVAAFVCSTNYAKTRGCRHSLQFLHKLLHVSVGSPCSCTNFFERLLGSALKSCKASCQHPPTTL